ncbi:C-type polyheme cytochrome OmcB [Geobacter sp. OR-1]|uniref:cytochrome c3 family protein n=1 Tax=Geobacter sp. OR-1 TaxID=1266765 RepID=UPI000542E5EC|nr:cytochrome c3 family protein [Geobacter sp. OR-1]GAM08455.1 C-type polyheme cytochrome OmcB [Geobacter sp. OR-1]
MAGNRVNKYGILCLFVLIITGCSGNSAPNSAAISTLAASQNCINCHESTAVSSVTGEKITTAWQLSAHNTLSSANSSGRGAGCGDCHEPEAGHPNSCYTCHGGNNPASGPLVQHNPDRAGKCLKCHGRDFPDDILMTNASTHFRIMKYRTNRFTNGTTNRPSYVSGQYTGRCRACHNPHNPTKDMAYNRAWAEGGMADTNSGAFGSRDFKSFGTDLPANQAFFVTAPAASSGNSNVAGSIGYSPGCVRCHTTTGFKKFVSSGFMDLKPFGNDLSGPYTASSDLSKEVVSCDACHTSYNFAVSTVPQVTIYYNFSAAAAGPPETRKYNNHPVTFPSIGPSNVCIPCHAGRGNGAIIKDPDGGVSLTTMGLNFSNTNSPSGHDFSGAAMLMAKSGYEFSGKEYRAGIGAVTNHDAPSAGDGRGPCITCHMNPGEPESHHFMAVEHGAQFPIIGSSLAWTRLYSVSATSPAALTIQNLVSKSCNSSSCHSGTITTGTLNEDKEGYISALAALNKWVRLVRNVPAKPQLPFNSSTNKARSATKWDFLGTGTGPDLMGAAFNLGLMNNEPGSYVHNPLYAKRLIYDSIFWLCTTATDPALGTLQYPQDQQTNVADAIQYLVTTTSRTLETISGVSNSEVSATITQRQADYAIRWLYGTDRTALTPSGKLKRPGDV